MKNISQVTLGDLKEASDLLRDAQKYLITVPVLPQTMAINVPLTFQMTEESEEMKQAVKKILK